MPCLHPRLQMTVAILATGMEHDRFAVVTPSAWVSVMVFTDSASGNPSNTSVDTTRDGGSMSR